MGRGFTEAMEAVSARGIQPPDEFIRKHKGIVWANFMGEEPPNIAKALGSDFVYTAWPRPYIFPDLSPASFLTSFSR